MGSLNIFDRDKNRNILIAGIITLIVGVGVARFVFTSLLPFMLTDTLELTFAGILASINYVGYLSGAIFAVFIKDINTKVTFFRIGFVICVVTSAILGVTTDETLWLISRVIAGFGSAMALVVGSAIVMTKLDFEDKTKAMGIHFSGIGFSILITDILCRVILSSYDWQDAWIILSIFASVLSFYPLYILSFDKEVKQNVVKHKFDKSIFTFFVIIVIIAYFTEGVGFVVQGTFLPDIINSLEGLENFGGLTWLMVGIAGVPSSIVLMRLAHRFGSINVIIASMFLQVIGILIPTITTNIYLNLLSGVLYGGTFIGLVALFMNLSGKFAKHNPVVLMGAFTTAYGIGQVTAPLYAVWLTEKSGNYDLSLYVTAFIVSFGALLLLAFKRFQLEKV